MHRFSWIVGAVAGLLAAAFAHAAPARAAELDAKIAKTVVERMADRASDGVALQWTEAGRSGTVQFGPFQRECRRFLITQISPERAPPLEGLACDKAAGFPPATYNVTELRPVRARDGFSADDAKSGETAPPSPPQPPVITTPPPPPSPSTMTTAAPPKPSRKDAAPGSAGQGPNPAGTGSGVGGGVTRSFAGVMVDIAPQASRRPRNGGSAVVLLSERSEDAARNLRLCRALYRTLDTATRAEIDAGERRTSEGDIEKLRPIYWLWKGKPSTASGDLCPSRIANYDFARAYKVRAKYGLSGRGPYLVIARADEQRAGVVDLGAAQASDTEDLVRYFRDGFSQDEDIWSPERHSPARAQALLAKFLGRSISAGVVTALVKPIAVATCPLGDFFDTCTTTPR